MEHWSRRVANVRVLYQEDFSKIWESRGSRRYESFLKRRDDVLSSRHIGECNVVCLYSYEFGERKEATLNSFYVLRHAALTDSFNTQLEGDSNIADFVLKNPGLY